MSVIDTLKTLAIKVRNEKKKEANSSIRIGDLFLLLIEFVKGLVSGQIRQEGVDTYNNATEGKTSLLHKYPKPEIGWTVLVRNDETNGGKASLYQWNGTGWINLETAIYNDDVAVKTEIPPVYMNTGVMEFLNNSQNVSITTFYNANNAMDRVVFNMLGFSIFANGTYYNVRGRNSDITFDHIKNGGGTRSFLWLDLERLIPYNTSPNTVYWDEDPNIFVVSTDVTDFSSKMKNMLLLFSWYDGQLTSMGYFSGLVAQWQLKKLNFVRSAAYWDFSNQTNLDFSPPKATVSSDYSTLFFPKGLTVLHNNTEYRTVEDQIIPFVPTRPDNPDILVASSIGYFFLNIQTKEIRQFWWSMLSAVDPQIWVCFGLLKRTRSESSGNIGRIGYLIGFPYEIDGVVPYAKNVNVGIEDALNSASDCFAFGDRSLTIKPTGFSLYVNGKRYPISGGGINGTAITFTASRGNTRHNVWIDVSLLSQTSTTNWNNVELFTMTSDDNSFLNLRQKVLFLTFYEGIPQTVGCMASIVAKYSAMELASKKYIFRQTFCGSGSNNSVVKVIPSLNKIIFPISFAIVNDMTGSVVFTSAQQEVPCICTSWSDVPTASSSGILVYNTDTKIIKNIWWTQLKNMPIGETWLPFGSIKRSTSSITTIGRVQIQGTFPYEITGGGGSELTIVQRNQDIDTLVDAAIFKKFRPFSGICKRFNFLHISDIHADADRYNNAIQYLNYKEDIVAMFVTGDIQAGNFTSDNKWFTENLSFNVKPICLTPGNHDVGNSKKINLCGANEQVYEKFIKPIEGQAGMITNANNYWYRDFIDYKIRVISIYEYDDPNDIDPNDATQYRIFRGVRVLSQQQIDWLLNTLFDTPSDYAVIMLTHQNPATSGSLLNRDDDWTVAGGFDPQNNLNGETLNEIVDAWMNGTSINKSYEFTGDASYLPAIEVNKDFTSRGKGEFIAFFFGHTHCDSVGSFVNFPNQKYICVTCASSDINQSQFDDLSRITGNKSEDAINLASIDRDEGNIYLVRIGANVNKHLYPRKYKIIKYK